MSLILRRIAPGGAISEQTLDGEVRIGRATDNHVQLPGLLVALHHVALTPLGGLRIQARCVSAADITVNDRPGLREAELRAGDRLVVGGHALRVTVDAGGALVLEVAEAAPGSTSHANLGITGLEQAGWRMRRPALWLAGAILLLTLIAPLLLRLLPLPDVARAVLPTDAQWSSGTLSHAHLHLQDRCESCHESAFQKVRNQACETCHQNLAPHAHDGLVQARIDDAAPRCAGCHFEHGGTHAVLPAHPGTCVECHAEPGDWPSLAAAHAVESFDAHPAFRVRVGAVKDGRVVEQRVVLDAQTRDHHRLVFPHDLHLDAKGLRGPDGKEVLACASCHRPAPGEVGFQPLDFARDCERCHSLEVDFAGERLLLPHGDSTRVRELLEQAVARAGELPAQTRALVDDEARRRPGERAQRGDDAPIDETDEVFERRVCAKCHEIDSATPSAPAVAPPQLRQSWMTAAFFTHAPHQWVDCETCHKASGSTDSSELLLPELSSCRSCHGDVGSADKIKTPCIDCHRFHGAAEPRASKNGAPSDETRPVSGVADHGAAGGGPAAGLLQRPAGGG